MPLYWSRAFTLATLRSIARDIELLGIGSLAEAQLHNNTCKWQMWFHCGAMCLNAGYYEVPASVVRAAWRMARVAA